MLRVLLFWRRPNRSLVLIQSCNKHAMRANVNREATRMPATRCVTTQHSSSLQYVSELTHGKQIGNRKQTYWKNKVHRVKQTINFLSKPLVNNAMFQRIKWISLNKWIRNTYQYRRLFIVFKYTEKNPIFYIEFNGSLHDFPRVLL